MRLIIADDFGPFRKALADLIRAKTDLDLVGEATNIEETLALIQQEQPDVVILNDNMPPYDSLEIIPQILEKWPETRIIMISMYPDSERAKKAIKAGVKAYILKPQFYEDFTTAVRAIHRGEFFVSEEVGRLIS